MKEQPRFSDIQFGPIRHPVLPRDFIKRIKAFKKILSDIDSVPIEQTIDNFKRDADPESELVIWERIASTFQMYLSHNPTADSAIRKRIFAVLLSASMGTEECGKKDETHRKGQK
jgi:Sec-independent protein translocase protein TatA